MNSQGFRCEGCQRNSHCYDFANLTDCACACPAYCHMYSAKNQEALCGVSDDGGAISNDWFSVTCPVCLPLHLSDSLK